MSNQTQSKYQSLSELILGFLAGELADDECRQLHQMLADDPKCQEYYIQYATLWALLDEYCEDQSIEELSEFDFSVLQAFAEYEKTAPTVEIEKPMPEKGPVKMLKIETAPRVINKSSLWTAIVSLAALVFVLIYVQVAPPPASSVAMITDSMNAQWAQSEHPTDIGSRLWDNEGSRWLQKGTVKITFDYGAEVIIEGPAEFELDDSDEMVLHSGRLYATVPRRATGFTVQTPCSTVIDLGTEFGIKVDVDGSADVHMFKGEASLIPGRMGEKKQGLELLAGQAKTISESGDIHDIKFQQQGFVRKLDSQRGIHWRGENLNLADVVGGGNGFGTGRMNQVINPTTGQTFVYKFVSRIQSKELHLKGTGQYSMVPSLPFTDGVFVPDGGTGPVQITSTGIEISDFPDTDGCCWRGISNGGEFVLSDGSFRTPAIFDGVTYNTKDHPAILISGNAGITFDLDAIRSAYPGIRLSRFTALCGVTQGITEDYNRRIGKTEFSEADFMVLVDGIVQFEKKGMTAKSNSARIAVDIDEQDRFLTLITSDAGDMQLDWGVFANPGIELVQDILP